MRTGRVARSIVVSVAVCLLALGQTLGAPGKGPVKVFLLAGQSNMEGHANVSTIDFLGEDPDPARAALLKKFKPDGKALVTRDDVWVMSNGAYFDKLQPGLGARKDASKLCNDIGPEYAFGYFMGEALEEQVLLIKVAEGGTSLCQNWRPPGAGPLAGAKPEEVGDMYRALVDSTRQTLRELKQHFPDYDEKAGYEIVGLVWFQGYNDMIQDGLPVSEYGRNLTCLIKDLRKEFNAPDMKVVVGVMGVNGPRNEIGKQGAIRSQMRSMNTVPEFKGNVKAIETAPLQHPKILELNCAGSPPTNVCRSIPNPPGNDPKPGRWLYPERDLQKNPITPDEQALLNRATSNLGFHYYGEGRFFILLGKAFADTMLELMRQPFAPAAIAESEAVRRLPLRAFQDKMKGAWLGQMIGVGWGAPTEFKVSGAIIPDSQMPPWNPGMVNQHGNDDCYVEMTFIKTLETYGFDVSIRQAGIDFANSGYPLWHANDAGRSNLRKGIAPPDSGHPQFNKHADDIDYQIEADFSGIIAPGLPKLAIALGEKFGSLMNYGDGRYAGQFIGGMYAEAYFESDVVKVIEAGLACIPSDSQYAGMIRDMLAWYKENPTDWGKTWQSVEAKYHKDPRYTHGLCSTTEGHRRAWSIDAKLNGAYILMGLLYGQGDPDKTIRIACRCGQDSDCNPANAAGIYFAMLGASKIPARFVEKLDLQAKFSHTDYTLTKVHEVSEMLARKAVLRGGGRIEKDANGGEVFVIPVQTPKPGPAEKSYEPGPIANSKFTAEELEKITAGR